MACLTLVAPSGMTAEDRLAWVAVARQTLAGIPGDLLEDGCAHVRRTCRFASEIVPTILDHVGSSWRWREKRLAEDRAEAANRNAPRLEKPTYPAVPREETRRIIREAFSARSIGDVIANIPGA